MTTIPEPVAIQLWSREPLTDAKRAELEQILKGGDAPCAAHAEESPDTQTYTGNTVDALRNQPGSDAAPTSEPLSAAVPPEPEIGMRWYRPSDSTIHEWDGKKWKAVFKDDPRAPWQDKARSIEEIKRLCGRLSQFCGAPIYISKVRAALAEAGVIKGKPQPKKRRIKRRRKRA